MYLLDANIFIQSNRAHYGLDFMPGFWQWLDQGHQAGVLCSIEKIKQELAAGEDELSTWASSRHLMFLSLDAATTPSLSRLAAWANSGGVPYTQAAVSEFLGCGDYQLVAYAAAHGHTVVTHEVSAPESKKRIKIPDACIAMGVDCINPFEMLRREKARFVMQT